MAAKWLQQFQVSHLDIAMSRWRMGTIPSGEDFIERGNLTWKPLQQVLHLSYGPELGQLSTPKSISGSGMGTPTDIDYAGPSSWRGSGLSLPEAQGSGEKW